MSNNNINTITKINNVIDISKNFILSFYKNAEYDDRMWILATMEKCVKEKGNDYYFPRFRTAFAKRYFPELFLENEKTKRLFSEELKNALENTQTAEEIKTPSKVVEITKKFVIQFYINANTEDREWIYTAAIENEGKNKNFSTFRKDFATKFFPHMFKKKSSFFNQLLAIA